MTRRNPIPPERLAAARRLRANGLTYQQIADALGGVSKVAAYWWVHPEKRPAPKPRPRQAFAIANDPTREREMRPLKPLPDWVRFDDDPASRRREARDILPEPSRTSAVSCALAW